nr:uncharacterized protein LOC122270488 [Parasteatoda tepidariorum]
MMGEELSLVKQIINARGNQRMMTKKMAPLKELDSAQESVIEEFHQRLEGESAYDRLLVNQDGFVWKIERFQSILAGFKHVYERVTMLLQVLFIDIVFTIRTWLPTVQNFSD